MLVFFRVISLRDIIIHKKRFVLVFEYIDNDLSMIIKPPAPKDGMKIEESKLDANLVRVPSKKHHIALPLSSLRSR